MCFQLSSKVVVVHLYFTRVALSAFTIKTVINKGPAKTKINKKMSDDYVADHTGVTLISHFRIAICLSLKTSSCSKPFNENVFELHYKMEVKLFLFIMNVFFAQKLILTQWQKVTWKWPVQSHIFVELGHDVALHSKSLTH